MRKINILALVLSMALTSCTVIAPVTASRAEIGDLRGVSETTVFFGIELNKNYGVKEAATNGKIKSAIATVDEKVTNYVLFQKKQLIVTAK
jgi:hypothetical protein